MPSDIHPINEFLRPAGEMGITLELKTSSKQKSNSKIVKEKVLSPKDKLKVKNTVAPPYSDLCHERRQDRDDKILLQGKSSGNRQRQCVKGNTSKDDELVKYMSNLPGYLQRAEKGENVQEKALNFGVLDWAKLEKWKYKQKRIMERGSKNASCSSIDLSLKTNAGSSTASCTVHKETFAEQNSLLRSSLNSSHKHGHPQGAESSVRSVMRFQDFQTASNSNMDGEKRKPWTYKSFGRNCSDVMLEKGKRKDLDHKITSEMRNLSSNLRNNRVLLSQKHNMSAWDGEAKKSIEELRESDIKRKDKDQRITSERGASSSKLRGHGFSIGSKEKLSVSNCETRRRVEELQESDIDVAHQRSSGDQENIVLLLPKELPQNGFSEVLQVSQPRTLSDETSSGADGSSFSDSFSSSEVHSAEICSKILHSCPLLSRVETNAVSDMMPHILTDAQEEEFSSIAYCTSPCSNKVPDFPSKGIYAEKNELDIKLTNSDVDSLKTLDHETAGLAARKGRNPLPNHRFSLNLGRIGRSFSFKEGSAIPQLSSSYVTVKSGPVRSESFGRLDNSQREKSNGHNRARSSPLRRLLDPILKYRVANPLHSAETVQPLEESLNSLTSWPTSVSDSLQNEKHEASTVEAHLQLTETNGLPLFKFELDNKRNILAATMKNLRSSGKDDSGQNYTFYYVNEIKKKSGGWMSQGSKRVSGGYVYNVIGQMKVSSSDFSALSRPNSKNQYMERESVLLGVDLRQALQEPLQFMPNRELAAIIVNIPCENLIHDAVESDKDLMEKPCVKCLAEDRCSCNFKENEDFRSITVVLPGGVHALPNKGEPSPLVDRWRTRGSCDCGGWDVGCKLRVLQTCKIPETSKGCPIPDRIELFVQGEAQQNKPIFSLTPLKDGMYSIEFNSSISMLQSFFICVAILSCKRPLGSETSNMSDEKVVKEPILNKSDGIERRGPPRYAPNPPPSLVERV